MIDYATWQRIWHLHRVERLTIVQIARGGNGIQFGRAVFGLFSHLHNPLI